MTDEEPDVQTSVRGMEIAESNQNPAMEELMGFRATTRFSHLESGTGGL
jgi:hypothetical protein